MKLFGPHRRSSGRRMKWGVERIVSGGDTAYDERREAEEADSKGLGGLLTPPPSPDLLPADEVKRRQESTVVLYVGRM